MLGTSALLCTSVKNSIADWLCAMHGVVDDVFDLECSVKRSHFNNFEKN